MTAAVVGDDRLSAQQWDWLTTLWPYADRRRSAGCRGSRGCGNGTWSRGGSPATSACSSRTSASLRRLLMRFPRRDIDGQPLPDKPAHRRPLRAAGQAPGRAEIARLRRHRRAGRSRRRAAPDHRLGRADAGPRLADARQQVPQAARPRPQAAAAAASWPTTSTAKTATSTSGPGSTSRT